MKNIKTTTWIALVVHLFIFSAISYGGMQKWGFSWVYVATAIVPPFIFFYQNIRDYDQKQQQ